MNQDSFWQFYFFSLDLKYDDKITVYLDSLVGLVIAIPGLFHVTALGCWQKPSNGYKVSESSLSFGDKKYF